jgi:hypothetical protein
MEDINFFDYLQRKHQVVSFKTQITSFWRDLGYTFSIVPNTIEDRLPHGSSNSRCAEELIEELRQMAVNALSMRVALISLDKTQIVMDFF